MIGAVLLIGLTAIAAVTDIRARKIYNANTYSGIVASIVLSGIAAFAFPGDSSEASSDFDLWGAVAPYECLAGLATLGGLTLVGYVLLGVGGGDVKLMTMIGGFLGWEKGLEAFLWTFVFAGCFGIARLGWRVGPLRLAGWIAKRVYWTLRFSTRPPLTDGERLELRSPLFLAPAALVAVIVTRFELLEWFWPRT